MPARPSPSSILELLKPVTWFAPMWAYGCGVVSAGVSFENRWLIFAGGVLLALLQPTASEQMSQVIQGMLAVLGA